MNFKLLAAAGAILASSAFGAAAATFDFVDLIDGPGGVNGIADGAGDVNGETSWSGSLVSGGWTRDGITLDVTASGNALSDGFLDAGAAGLGVCSSTSCVSGVSGAATGDDNLGFVGAGGPPGTLETLELAFSTDVTMFDLVLRDGGHVELNTGDLFWINGIGELSYVAGGVDLSIYGARSDWDFQRRWDGFDTLGKELYISTLSVSAIPLPAGAVLLLSGFGGLAALRRRRKS